jgi:cytochrome c-type biogenesis protein CcmH/NrfG
VDAEPADIDAAYHEFARTWHPDRFYSRDTGELGSVLEDNFVTATRAFKTLKEPAKRQAYNLENRLEVRPRAPAAPARPAAPPPGPAPAVGLGGRLSGAELRTDTTSPGGTPIYEVGVSRPRATPAAAGPAPAPAGTATPPSAGVRAPVEAPRPTPPPRPPPANVPKTGVSAAVEKMRAQVAGQLAKAKQYYDAGKEDFDQGRYAKAEGALYLALQYDPKNEVYAALHKQASARAKEGRAKGYIAQAEQEESYQRIKEAIAAYQKGVECDPPEGIAFFRLANLLRNHENDERGALGMLRKAAMKEPNNITYRLALGEMYADLGLGANALREATAALAIDPKNDAAKQLMKRARN